MSTVAYDQNALGTVTRVRGVYPDNSPEAQAALREPLEPVAMGEQPRVDRVPDLAEGELVEGRLHIGRRFFGIVRENRLGSDVSYRIHGYQVENNDWRPRTIDIDARARITRIRLIANLLAPVPCDLHLTTIEPRWYFLADADGQTPATEALVHLPLALQIPCNDPSHHPIEVHTGDKVTLDGVDANDPVYRWPPTPAEQAANVARVVGWDVHYR